MTGHGYLVVPITAESQRVWKSEQNNECDWDFMGMTNKLGFFALVGHTQIQFFHALFCFVLLQTPMLSFNPKNKKDDT